MRKAPQYWEYIFSRCIVAIIEYNKQYAPADTLVYGCKIFYQEGKELEERGGNKTMGGIFTMDKKVEHFSERQNAFNVISVPYFVVYFLAC
jgi:hypothetical protein